VLVVVLRRFVLQELEQVPSCHRGLASTNNFAVGVAFFQCGQDASHIGTKVALSADSDFIWKELSFSPVVVEVAATTVVTSSLLLLLSGDGIAIVVISGES
jgi:hypothetical protein